MRYRLPIAALALCLGAFAQSYTVDTLVQFLRSSIKLKQSDRDVASQVSKMHLSEKVTDQVIEQLQGEGLGPKTVAALRSLSASTANLPVAELKKPAAPPPPAPPPPPEAQKKILDEAREYALNYSKSLPNFICAQYTRRYGDASGGGNYRLYDSVLAKLTYFEQHEKYDTITVNDKMTNQAYESLSGSISTGEFGSMLVGIFDPSTETTFTWSRLVRLHGQRANVFNFSVDQPHSRWLIEDRDSHTKIAPAYEGTVWINASDNTVMAFTQKAVDLPATFAITSADTRLDYNTVEISGVPFVLPLMAVMHMRSGKQDQKNEIEFRNYHKYSADASLKFDEVVPDTPDDKSKEKK